MAATFAMGVAVIWNSKLSSASLELRLDPGGGLNEPEEGLSEMGWCLLQAHYRQAPGNFFSLYASSSRLPNHYKAIIKPSTNTELALYGRSKSNFFHQIRRRENDATAEILTKMAPETPRGPSSRLLTMKFMQRAVASAASSPQPDENSQTSKKRKLKHSATAAAEERISAMIDQASIKAAIEEQEAKRQAALALHSATGAHWVLNTKLDKLNASKPSEPSLNVVYVGYGDIDSSNESGGEDAPQSGRTSTRKPKVVEEQACLHLPAISPSIPCPLADL